jgi:imidazole glycerol-phosphate synthase subunit HisF
MLRSRVIPCLLIHEKGLVKTVKFRDPKYVGDPINAVKIFNEKAVDELMVLDIDASRHDREPDYDTIRYIANECRMPLCYGGGVKTVLQAKKIIELGVEKVAISSGAIENPSVFGKYEIYTHNYTKKAKQGIAEVLHELERIGIGELVVNSIDCDGSLAGFDETLAQYVRNVVTCPLTILGGAGSQDDILKIIQKFKIIGAAAGSLFVFKGPYKAVLISYLDVDIRKKIRQISHKKG